MIVDLRQGLGAHFMHILGVMYRINLHGASIGSFLEHSFIPWKHYSANIHYVDNSCTVSDAFLCFQDVSRVTLVGVG